MDNLEKLAGVQSEVMLWNRRPFGVVDVTGTLENGNGNEGGIEDIYSYIYCKTRIEFGVV